MIQLLQYFDLRLTKFSPTLTAGKGHVWPQYIVLVLGVIAEPYLRAFASAGTFDGVEQSLVGRVVFGAMMGVVLLPGVYKNSFDPNTPIAIQLMALFPIGIGWQSLFSAATSTVVAPVPTA